MNVPSNQTFYLRTITIRPPTVSHITTNTSVNTNVRDDINQRGDISLNGSPLLQYAGIFHSRVQHNALQLAGAAAASSAYGLMTPLVQQYTIDLDGPATLTFSCTAGYTGSVAGYMGEPYDPYGWSITATSPSPTATPAPTPSPTATPTPAPSTVATPTPAPVSSIDPAASSTVGGLTADAAASLAGGLNRVLDAALLVVGFGFLARIWWRLSRGAF